MMTLKEKKEMDDAFKKAQKPWAKLYDKVNIHLFYNGQLIAFLIDVLFCQYIRKVTLRHTNSNIL